MRAMRAKAMRMINLAISLPKKCPCCYFNLYSIFLVKGVANTINAKVSVPKVSAK